MWKQCNGEWIGINGQNIIKITKNHFKIKSSINDFFRLDDNIDDIISEISNDKVVKKAINLFPGLRLLRQDPFQCYISFIVSSNSNIQNIKNCLQKICKKFGEKVDFEKEELFLFPSPEKLSSAKISELIQCGLGYRAKYVKEASKDVVSGKIDFDFLKKSDYYTAKETMLQSFGVGNKVADCILLFSLDKLDSFPLDRWMIRILQKYYPSIFQFNGKTITPKKYDELHEMIVDYFGQYAGYAQQFLFKMEREIYQKKWL